MSDDTRPELAERLASIGISKKEFAERISIDRGTLDRAIDGDLKVSPRTWAKIDRGLVALEDELGMAESGELVTTVIEFEGAKVTVKGKPADVAATVREIVAPTVGADN